MTIVNQIASAEVKRAVGIKTHHHSPGTTSWPARNSQTGLHWAPSFLWEVIAHPYKTPASDKREESKYRARATGLKEKRGIFLSRHRKAIRSQWKMTVIRKRCMVYTCKSSNSIVLSDNSISTYPFFLRSLTNTIHDSRVLNSFPFLCNQLSLQPHLHRHKKG